MAYNKREKLQGNIDATKNEDFNEAFDYLAIHGNEEVARIIEEARDNESLPEDYRDTDLTPTQWVYVRTEEFRRFFGDYLSQPNVSSQVKDFDTKEPLMLYHGTLRHDFETFRNEGNGIYFTPSLEAAQTYGGNDVNPYKVFVNMRNPLIVNFDGDTDTEENEYHKSLEDEYLYAVKEGYDGVIALNTFDGENVMDQYVVHNPENIMLADDKHLLERMGISSELAKDVPGVSKIDEEYLHAVTSSDIAKAERMVREAAEKAGYKDSTSSYQGSTDQFGAAPVDDYGYSQSERQELWENGDLDGNITLEDMAFGISISSEDEYITSNRSTFRLDDMRKQAVGNLRDALHRSIQEGNNTTIMVYRVVPKDIVEQHLRVGDWVSPSSDYAVHTGNIRYGEGNYNIIKQEVNIKHLWWDGNDIAEWGYDDNSEKNVYQNVENNRKTLATVTYDDNNHIIPLSKRFDVNNSDIRFQKKIEDPSSNISFVVTQTMTNGMGHFAVEFDNKTDYLRYASLDEINTAAKTYDAHVSVLPSDNNKIVLFDIQTAEEARDLGNELRSFLAHRMNQNDYEVIDTRGMQEDNNFVVDFGFRRNLTENISVEEIDSIGNKFDALVIHYPFQNNRIEAFDFRSEADARQFGDHITALYEERQKQKEYQAKPVESPLRDALVERMRNAGIKVSTDRTEAIAVLQSVNGNIQMSKLTGVAPLVSSSDDNVMRRNLLARPVTQHEIETAKNSNLLRSWSRYNVPNSGVKMFGPVSQMLRTVAKACLGIDSKYDVGSIFWDPYDYIGEIVEVAKQNGLEGPVTEKIDWKSRKQSSDAIRKALEKGEPTYTEQEVDEVCKHLPESLANQFRECVFVASQEKNIQDEINRISEYENGAAVTQAFILYDIATRRMREQFGHYENDYYKKTYVLVTQDGERHFNPGWKTPEDVRLKKNEPIGENDRIEVEYSLRAKVSDSLLTAIATMPVVQEILGVENKDQGIESQNFKNWFGDWQNDSENASKVVSWNEENERVEPTVVYHGTRNGFFPVFDKDMIGSSWNADDEGFFFTESKDLGEDYTKPVYNGQSGKPHLFDVYLDIKKPLVIDRQWYAANYNNRRISDHDAVEVWDDNREDILEAKKNGDYDGIIIDTTGYGASQPKMYVVFEPTQIKSANKNVGTYDRNNSDIRYFRTSDGGQAYGFVHKGTIYLDPAVATAETAIHEYTHLWSEVLRQRNPEEWNNIVSLMKQEKELWHEIKMNYPELTTDDAIADEVLAHFSGRRGSVIETVKGVEKYGILDFIVEAVNRFWKFVGEFFNIHYTSKEEVADKVFADLVKGINPLDYAVKNDNNIHLMKEGAVINPIYTGLFVQDVPALADKYNPTLPVDYGTHITQAFRPGEIDSSTLGLTRNVPIRGRLITDKVDVLLVDISDTNNEYPHITLATAEGVAPKESNTEIAKYLELREKFDQLDFEIQNDAPWDTNLSKEEYESHRVEYEHLKEELQKYQFTELEDYVTVKSGAFMGVQNINYGDSEKSEATPSDKLSLIYEILGGTSYEKEDVLKHIKDEKIKDLILKNDRLYNATVLDPEERKAARSEYFDSVQKLDQALSAYVGVNDINDVDELTKRYDELSAEADKDVEKELEYKHVITPATRMATETLVDILKNNTGINLIMNTQEEGQYVADKVNTYSVELMSISDKFDIELQQQIDGMLPEGHIYNMGMPSSKLLSCGIPYLPIQLNSTRLKIKSNDFDHNFELSEVKGLVKAINDPIAVFNYGKNNTARNIIVNIKHEGKNFLIGMFLNPNINGRCLEINSVRNVFPKDTNEWVNWIQQGKLLGGYTQKIQVEIDKRRINLADVKYLNLDLVANILKNGEYIKFQDIKNHENIEFMQRPDGIVYGWSVGNEIHITPEGINPNALVHEYTHLWAHAMLQNDSESWNTIKSTMQKTPMWQEVLSDREYQNIATNEDAITSEVLARLSGKNNAEKIVREADKMLSSGTADSTDTRKSLIQKLSASIGKFWGWVSENVFHIKGHYNNWQMDSMEVSDRVLYDLLNKKNINLQVSRVTDNVRLQKAIIPTKDIIEAVFADRSYYGMGSIIGKALEEKYGEKTSLETYIFSESQNSSKPSNLSVLSSLRFYHGMPVRGKKDISSVRIFVDDNLVRSSIRGKLEFAAAVKDMSHIEKDPEYAKAILVAGLMERMDRISAYMEYDRDYIFYVDIPIYLSLDAENTKVIVEKYEEYHKALLLMEHLIEDYHTYGLHFQISDKEIKEATTRKNDTFKAFEKELFSYLGINSREEIHEQYKNRYPYIEKINASYNEALNDVQSTIDSISKEDYQKLADGILSSNLADVEGEKELQSKVLTSLRNCGIEVIDSIAEANIELGIAPYADIEITASGRYAYGVTKNGRTDIDNKIVLAETELDAEKLLTINGGRVYGFTKNGKIYVDTNIATAETAIHEYTHLWAEAIRQRNPEEWEKIFDILSKDKTVEFAWNTVKKEYPELKDGPFRNDDQYEEVLAHYSGFHGHGKLLQDAEKTPEPRTFIQSISDAVTKFWSEVTRMLGINKQHPIKNMKTAAEVADRILSDLMRGVNPNKDIAEPRSEVKLQKVGQTNVNKVSWFGNLDVYSVSSYRPISHLAHRVKEGDNESKNLASHILAGLVKRVPNYENSVLIPVPNRSGRAEYTLDLANRISKELGIPVTDVLDGKERKSLYSRKESKGKDGIRLFKYNLLEEIPKNKKVILIDNVLDTGTTAMSALRAIGKKTSLVVLGTTQNYKKYNYPIQVNISPVMEAMFAKSRIDNIKDLLVKQFNSNNDSLYDKKLYNVLNNQEIYNWDDVFIAGYRLQEQISKDYNTQSDNDEFISIILKNLKQVQLQEAAERLSKDVRTVYGGSLLQSIEATEINHIVASTIEHNDCQQFVNSLNKTYLLGKYLNSINKSEAVIKLENLVNISYQGEDYSISACLIERKEDMINVFLCPNVASGYSKEGIIKEDGKIDASHVYNELYSTLGVLNQVDLYADNYHLSTDSEILSKIDEKLGKKFILPNLLSDEEVQMITKMMEFESGVNILVTPPTESYKKFENYVHGVNLKVAEGELLLEREKAIIKEEAKKYYGNMRAFAASVLNVSESYAYYAIDVITKKEYEFAKTIDQLEKKAISNGYSKGYSEDLGLGLGEYAREEYYDEHYQRFRLITPYGECFSAEINEFSENSEPTFEYKSTGIGSSFYQVSPEEWNKRLSEVLLEFKEDIDQINDKATKKNNNTFLDKIFTIAQEVQDKGEGVAVINSETGAEWRIFAIYKNNLSEPKFSIWSREEEKESGYAKGLQGVGWTKEGIKSFVIDIVSRWNIKGQDYTIKSVSANNKEKAVANMQIVEMDNINKNAMDKNIEKASVFKPREGFYAGKWIVTALVDGNRKSALLSQEDITAYFKRNEQGDLLRELTPKELAEKYLGESIQSVEDYSKYKFNDSVTVEKASVFKATEGFYAGKWIVTALVDGNRKSALLSQEDITAYFKRNEQGELLHEVSSISLAAKYFSEQEKVNEEEKVEEKVEGEMKEEPKKEQEISEKTALLVSALASVSSNNGMWLNKSGKTGIELYPQRVINGFNALLMAIHSDKNNFKTNVYTSFSQAKEEGFPVKKGMDSLPYTWYKWDKYCNKYDESNVIDKKIYDSLPQEEKEMYRVTCTKEIRPVFNLDQTLMAKNMPESYRFYLDAQSFSSVVGTSETESIKQRLNYVREKKELAPDHVIAVAVGDNFEIYGTDARIVAKILGKEITTNNKIKDLSNGPLVMLSLPVSDMEMNISEIIKNGTKISIASENELSYHKRYNDPGKIYEKMDDMISKLKQIDKLKITSLQENCHFDGQNLVISNRRTAPIGMSISTAIERANDLFRNVAAYVGTEDKLNRSGNLDLLSKDADKYDRLVQELSVGVIMTRMGLPSVMSTENRELVNYWQRELRENPNLTARLEKDINNTVKVIEEIQHGRGQEIDYAGMRGVVKNPNIGKSFTIIEDINKQSTMENKNIVLIHDAKTKTVDVILPEGASLDMSENISGMNKNRILSAIIKRYGEGTKVNWYNAGGELGLKRSNEYFADKEIVVAKLKQYKLIPLTKIDVKEEIARTSQVVIKNATMIRDDKGEWAFYVLANNEKEPFTVYPDKKDTDKFFQALHTDNFQSVVNELSTKYYNLIQQHPEMKKNILMPEVENKELVDRITKVSITKRKGSDETVLWATLDGKKLPPHIISKEAYQRFFLVSDQEAYKLQLAAKLIETSRGKDFTNQHQEEEKKVAEEKQKEEEKKNSPEQKEKEKQEEKAKEEATKAETKAVAAVALSPMLKQFMDLKKKHPDALLLFRCGAFYETYMQDAEKSSEILGITLTKSSKTKDPDGKPLAMAGFPYHALDTYLPKLIRAGQRVAICDQIEAPKQTVKRGISDLVTPGASVEKEQKTQPKEDQAQGYHR